MSDDDTDKPYPDIFLPRVITERAPKRAATPAKVAKPDDSKLTPQQLGKVQAIRNAKEAKKVAKLKDDNSAVSERAEYYHMRYLKKKLESGAIEKAKPPDIKTQIKSIADAKLYEQVEELEDKLAELTEKLETITKDYEHKLDDVYGQLDKSEDDRNIYIDAIFRLYKNDKVSHGIEAIQDRTERFRDEVENWKTMTKEDRKRFIVNSLINGV
jgi:hypothetical protein